MKHFEKQTYVGNFFFSEGTSFQGVLELKGLKSNLSLHSNEHYSIPQEEGLPIFGILKNKTRVSLIDCTSPPIPGRVSRGNEKSFYSDHFPHYAIFGEEHLNNSDEKIKSVHVLMQDAETLFYDFDVFGLSIGEEEKVKTLINQVIEGRENKRELNFGPYPKIYYYTGKQKIFEAKTTIGTVSATHNPTFVFPSPKGIKVKNRIFINVEFEKPKTFSSTMSCLYNSRLFFEMVVGRPQYYKGIEISLVSKTEHPEMLSVYSSCQPKKFKKNKPHPGDNLLDAVENPEAFSKVLASWIDRHEDWRESRAHFYQSFKEEIYSPARLVGVANAFDNIPISRFKKTTYLKENFTGKIEEAIEEFKKLPDTPDRNNLLSFLSKFKGLTLKGKVKQRAKLITEKLPGKFPEIEKVIDGAIDCRNYFVHGTNARKIPYNDNNGLVIYFTNFLEFVFGISDLLDSGWNIEEWNKRTGGVSHPFSSYLKNYDYALNNFKKFL